MSFFPILDQITEARRLCEEAGHHPKILLMGPITFAEKLLPTLLDLPEYVRVPPQRRGYHIYHKFENGHLEMLGLTLRPCPFIPDFLIVAGDVSWSEQKW